MDAPQEGVQQQGVLLLDVQHMVVLPLDVRDMDVQKLDVLNQDVLLMVVYQALHTVLDSYAQLMDVEVTIGKGDLHIVQAMDALNLNAKHC
jgi:hypothetical protein